LAKQGDVEGAITVLREHANTGDEYAAGRLADLLVRDSETIFSRLACSEVSFGALLAAAEAEGRRSHALVTLLALNGLQIEEAPPAFGRRVGATIAPPGDSSADYRGGPTQSPVSVGRY
jgi:hypothetical protein